MSTDFTGEYCPSKDKLKLSEQQATDYIRRMKHSRKYKCEICNTWHITSTRHQRNRKRR